MPAKKDSPKSKPSSSKAVAKPTTKPATKTSKPAPAAVKTPAKKETSTTPKNKSGYDAGSIQVLEGLEAVRKRPGMYIGSTGPRGLHHLVYEIVDNSVDEALAGHCDDINVYITPKGWIKVTDNGRGIPVDLHPVEKKPAVEVVLTVLHAGGKFGGGGYAVSGGLHGVGASVVNALSTDLKVEVARDGFLWSQEYKIGVPQKPLAKGKKVDHTGTTIEFKPDGSIFETVEFDYETLRARFQQMAFLNKGLGITITDERTGKTESYKYTRGLVDYVEFLNASKKIELVHDEIISLEAETSKKDMSIEVAMQWTNAYTESVHTYANTINTHEGGTHEEGFRTAITSLLNKYARANNLLKEKDENLSGDDVREG
jgi:DNA gyrase subunit B